MVIGSRCVGWVVLRRWGICRITDENWRSAKLAECAIQRVECGLAFEMVVACGVKLNANRAYGGGSRALSRSVEGRVMQ